MSWFDITGGHTYSRARVTAPAVRPEDPRG